MPICHVLDHTNRLIRTRITGSVTIADIEQHLEAMRGAKALAYAELIDARSVTAPWLSTSEILAVARLVYSNPPERPWGPRAIVLGDRRPWNLARLFVFAVSAYLPAQVFGDSEEAAGWLRRVGHAG